MRWTGISMFGVVSLLFVLLMAILGRSEKGGPLPAVVTESSGKPFNDVSGNDPGKSPGVLPDNDPAEENCDVSEEPLVFREVTFFANTNARSRLLLRSLGVRFLGVTGRNRALVRIPSSRLSAVRKYPGVRGIARPVAKAHLPGGSPPDQVMKAALQVHPGFGLETVHRGIRNPRVRVVSKFPKLNTMILEGRKADLAGLTSLRGVRIITSISETGVTNAGCATLSRVDLAREGTSMTGELDGSGISVGIWDAEKVDPTHPDLYGKVQNMSLTGGWNYHATHVAGTILGSGLENQEAMGMAPGATLKAWSIYEKTTQGTINQWIEKTDDYHVANNSWGRIAGWKYNGGLFNKWYGGPEPDKEDAVFGRYTDVSRLIDYATASDDRLIIISAGNDRSNFGVGEHSHYAEWAVFNCTHPKDGRDDDDPEGLHDGFDTLSPTSVAKNPIMVGAVTKEGEMSEFSSWGPTDDGRIKPDIVAAGVGVVSTATNGWYWALSGTSMSSPVVTGSIALLLQQMELSGYAFGKKPPLSMVKALLIHTAVDLETTGPDYMTGWGLLDVKEAVDLLDADVQKGKFSRIKLSQIGDGETITASFHAEAGDPLQVTIAWSDLPGHDVFDLPTDDPGEGALMNDLDLELVGPDGEKVSGAWVLDPADPLAPATRNGATNNRDNVEQVRVDAAPVGGLYTVRISHKGTLAGLKLDDPVQPFSLVSGHDISDPVQEKENPPGDLNGDGDVNVVDYQKMILVILKKIELTPELSAAADINADGKVNVVDLIALIKLIMES